jgi:hypothetical protein
MLATLDVPNIIGVNVGFVNVGELKSWGTELDLRWRDKAGKLNYDIGFSISDNQNKVMKYDGKNSIGSGGVVPIMEGYPLNTVWGYKTAGYFQSQAEANDYKAKVTYLLFQCCCRRHEISDLNGDGVITGGDGTYKTG